MRGAGQRWTGEVSPETGGSSGAIARQRWSAMEGEWVQPSSGSDADRRRATEERAEQAKAAHQTGLS